MLVLGRVLSQKVSLSKFDDLIRDFKEYGRLGLVHTRRSSCWHQNFP